MTELDIVKKIIKESFANKTDKAGKPYIEHLQRVASNFKEHTTTHHAALLHDLLEDCPEWNEKSLRTLIDDRVIDLVVTLTKGKSEKYEDYINRIKANDTFSFATDIKIADLRDNMDITRLKSLEASDIIRLEKYHKAYKTLNN